MPHLDTKQAQSEYITRAEYWLGRNPNHAVIGIIGLPGCGKTTLALELGRRLELPVLHTDKYRDAPWAHQADLAVLAAPERGIVEGLTVARMIRRGFHPDCLLLVDCPPMGVGENSLYAIITNGVREYENTLSTLPGRVIRLPRFPSPSAVLTSMGNPTLARTAPHDTAGVRKGR